MNYPTLRGRLSVHVYRGRPYLTLTVYCPHCRASHEHSWTPDADTPEITAHRAAHCWRGPLRERGYYIGLDAAHMVEAAAAIAEYRARRELTAPTAA
jgi:hypothetical protein